MSEMTQADAEAELLRCDLADAVRAADAFAKLLAEMHKRLAQPRDDDFHARCEALLKEHGYGEELA